MLIAKNTVVSLEYTLKDDEGDMIDASEGEPFAYLHGHDGLVPGLERALEGQGSGYKLKIVVPPEDGYGLHDGDRVVLLTPDEFPPDLTPEVGMELNAETHTGDPISLWVAHIDDEGITVDGNHPLAGQALHFAVEVLSVREATPEEIQHGHPHDAEQAH